MAKGFIYYNCDTDRYQDIKIKRLKKEFSGNGVAVYDYILNEIYRTKGSYLEWDESVAFDVADYWGIDEDAITGIVEFCCKIGLFNNEKFNQYSVLTSASIQARFIKWSVMAKRKDAKVPEKYIILQEETTKLPEEKPKVLEVLYEEKRSKEKYLEVPEREVKEFFTPEPDFENLILSFWGFSEQNHFRNFKKFRECCAHFFYENEFEHFKNQCKNYKVFTELIGLKFKHTFDNFLGKQEEGFDGVWNKENWELKIIEEKEKGSGKKENKGTEAVLASFSNNTLRQ